MRSLRVSLIALALVVVALLPTPSAQAATKATYVGIVISGHGTGCVKWHSGITGDDILNDVASVHYRRDGLIDQIDGQPSPPHADATHYWSYWNDASSSWGYSGDGAGRSTPKRGSVEGWSFANGKAKASSPAQNARGLYAALCGSRDPRAPATPTRRHSAAKPVTRTGATHASRAPAPNGPAARPSGHTSATVASPLPRIGTATTPGARRSGSTGAGTPPNSATAGDAATSAGPSFVDQRPASSNSKPSSGSVLPVILGLALAVLLAGGAGWTVLRRRRAEAADH